MRAAADGRRDLPTYAHPSNRPTCGAESLTSGEPTTNVRGAERRRSLRTSGRRLETSCTATKVAKVSEIIPRWEWRRFGKEFGDIDATLVPTGPRAGAGERRGLRALDVRDRRGQAPRRPHGRQAPVVRGRRRAGAVDSRDEGRTPRSPRATSGRCSWLWGWRLLPPWSARRTRSATFVDEVVSPHPDLRRGRGAQAAGAVHDRRLPGGADEVVDTPHGIHPHGGDRVRGCGPGGRRGARDRVRRRGPTSLRARPQGPRRFGTERYAVIDVGTNSVKFHVGERGTDGAWRRIVDRAETTRLGEGLQETGRLNEEPIERTVEAIAGMVDEAWQSGAAAIAAVGTGRSADRPQQRRAHRRRTGTQRRHRRGHLRGGGEPAGLPGGEGGSRRGDGLERRLRHGRGQLAVHVRRGRPGRRAVQRRRGRGPLHRGVRPRRRRLRGRSGRCAGRDRRGPGSPRRRGPLPTPSSPWVGQSRTLPRSSTAWPSTTPTSCRAPCSTGPRSTDRSSSTAPAAPTSVARSSACSRSAPTSSSRAPASCGRCWASWDADSLTVSDRGLRHGVLVERFG